jgi:CRISPR-associated protein Cas1
MQVLEWLGERHDVKRELELSRREAKALPEVASLAKLRTVESRVASHYWEAYHKVLPNSSGFLGRKLTSRQMNATDAVNLALNHGYGFLKAECRMAINAIGFESGVGFIHEASAVQTRESLVYDLMEPFRWLIDLTVMRAFESGTLCAADFYFTEHNYRYQFETEAKGRFLNALRDQFNSGLRYKARVVKWDTVIEEKTRELGRFLIGKAAMVDFSEPQLLLERADSQALRDTILKLTQSDAKKAGIAKSTLHYLRKRADNQQPFHIYSKVREKIVQPVEPKFQSPDRQQQHSNCARGSH